MADRSSKRITPKSLVKAPAEYRLGPAMMALNERQRAFVVALLELGTNDFSRAAAMAGYGQTPGSTQVQGSRLAHDEKVIAALREEAQKRLSANSVVCVSTLLQIVEGNIPGCTVKDRTKAIEMVLNRTGLHALTEHKVAVEHSVSNDEAMRKIALLSQRLGLDPKKLLGAYGMDIVEGEFTDVTPYTEEPDAEDEFTYVP